MSCTGRPAEAQASTFYDQTTLGDSGISRWMAGAAQDNQGNIGFEYSTGNENKEPSIVYSGRLATEPVGTFRTEEILAKGTGVQKAFRLSMGKFYRDDG